MSRSKKSWKFELPANSTNEHGCRGAFVVIRPIDDHRGIIVEERHCDRCPASQMFEINDVVQASWGRKWVDVKRDMKELILLETSHWTGDESLRQRFFYN